MKLTFRDIAPFLQKPNRDLSIFLIYGPEAGLVQERTASMIPKLIDDISDPMAISGFAADDVVDNESLLLDELSSVALLGPAQRVIKISRATDTITPALKEAVALNNDDIKIIVTAGSLGPKSALRLFAEKDKKAVALPCYVEDEQQISQFITSYLRDQNCQFEQEVAHYLAQNLVGDRMIATRQLEKLVIYAGQTRTPITLKDVQDVIPDLAGQTIDQFVYAAFESNWPVVFRALDALLHENIPFMLLLRSLQNHARKLEKVQLNVSQGMSMEQAIKALQPPIFFKLEKSFRQHLMRWSLNNIHNLQSDMIDLETDLKTYGTDMTHALLGQWLITHMTRTPQRRTA